MPILEGVDNLDSPLDQLTSRQREVLQLIVEGYSMKEIANRIDASDRAIPLKSLTATALECRAGSNEASCIQSCRKRSGLGRGLLFAIRAPGETLGSFRQGFLDPRESKIHLPSVGVPGICRMDAELLSPLSMQLRLRVKSVHG
jgi:hypothetical protein